MSAATEQSIQAVRRFDGREYVPVCATCGTAIRAGEPRAVINTRYLACQRCLYESERR